MKPNVMSAASSLSLRSREHMFYAPSLKILISKNAKKIQNLMKIINAAIYWFKKERSAHTVIFSQPTDLF